MRIRFISTAAICFLMLFGCSPYRIPYLSLDLKSVYDRSDITVNYTYVCEDTDQRCVYSLYNKALPSVKIDGDDSVLPSSGSLKFSGLEEGDYRLEFSVFSERNGEYSLLKFLDESYDFSVDIP